MATQILNPTEITNETTGADLLQTLQHRHGALLHERSKLKGEFEEFARHANNGVPRSRLEVREIRATGDTMRDEIDTLDASADSVAVEIEAEQARMHNDGAQRAAEATIRKRGGADITIELVRAAVTANVANFASMVEHVERLSFRVRRDNVLLADSSDLAALVSEIQERISEAKPDEAAVLRDLAAAVRGFANSNDRCRDLATAMRQNDMAVRRGTGADREAARGGLSTPGVVRIWARGKSFFEPGTLKSALDHYQNELREGPIGTQVQLLED